MRHLGLAPINLRRLLANILLDRGSAKTIVARSRRRSTGARPRWRLKPRVAARNLLGCRVVPPSLLRQATHCFHHDLFRLRREQADAAGVEAARLVTAFAEHPGARQITEDVIAIASHPEPVRSEGLFQHRE